MFYVVGVFFIIVGGVMIFGRRRLVAANNAQTRILWGRRGQAMTGPRMTRYNLGAQLVGGIFAVLVGAGMIIFHALGYTRL